MNKPPLFPPMDILEVTAKYREYHVAKVTTFTPDPVTIPNDLTVAVIFDEFCELAYIRPVKNIMWTRITSMKIRMFWDVIYYQNQFFSLTMRGGQTCAF